MECCPLNHQGSSLIWLFLFLLSYSKESQYNALTLQYRVLTIKLSENCSVVSDSATPWAIHSSWNSPGQNTGAGSLSLLQGIFPTQGLNLDLMHCRWILYRAEPPGKPKNTGVGSLSLLQGIFPTQESNRGLPHCRQILYQLSYRGNPTLLTQLFLWSS